MTGGAMPLKLLFVVFTVNSVISQLLLRRATLGLGRSPGNLSALPHYIWQAALSPWIYASVTLQVVSYVLWMLIVAREKLGVATATIGAGFYVLMAVSAWAVYGESLSPVQWIGILLVTCGVVCVSQAHA
jgi:drug/metabolite transporter (DMT)-like permease